VGLLLPLPLFSYGGDYSTFPAHRRQGVRKQRASRVQEPANSRSPASCVRIRLRREVLTLVAMQREPFQFLGRLVRIDSRLRPGDALKRAAEAQ
jgi:hypothetical protein